MYHIEESRTRTPIYKNSEFFRVGFDVAGEGNDDSMISVAKGLDVIEFTEFQNADDWELRDYIMLLSNRYHPKEIVIDYNGIGRGVYNLLKEAKCPNIKKFVSQKSPTKDKDKYKNRRDQAYFNLRDMFKNGSISFSLATGEKIFKRLRRELVATGFKVIENGLLKVDTKEKIKERLGGKSPDAADTLMMMFSGLDYDAMYAAARDEKKKKRGRDRWENEFDKDEFETLDNWMAV